MKTEYTWPHEKQFWYFTWYWPGQFLPTNTGLTPSNPISNCTAEQSITYRSSYWKSGIMKNWSSNNFYLRPFLITSSSKQQSILPKLTFMFGCLSTRIVLNPLDGSILDTWLEGRNNVKRWVLQSIPLILIHIIYLNCNLRLAWCCQPTPRAGLVPP